MPRYFFHRTDGFVDHDDDGTELEGPVSARAHAVVFAGECLRDRPDYSWSGQEFRIEVTDEDGQLLFTVVTLAVDSTPTKRVPRPEKS